LVASKKSRLQENDDRPVACQPLCMEEIYA